MSNATCCACGGRALENALCNQCQDEANALEESVRKERDHFRAALVKILGIGFDTAMVSYWEGLDRAREIASEALLNPPKG